MDELTKEIIEAIYSINCDISDRAEEITDELQYVYVESDSFTFVVKFLGCTIFNSDDDDRDCNDDDEYILSVEEHLRINMLDCVKMADHIRNVIVSKNLTNPQPNQQQEG